MEKSTKRIAVALGLYASSALYIDSLAGMLTGALTIFQTIPEGIANAYRVASKYFTLLVTTVIDKAKILDKAGQIVTNFLNKVKAAFYDAWDKVVGNSYWPDLVEGVISWAQKLHTDGLKLVNSFTKSVVGAFERLSERASRLSFSKVTESINDLKEGLSKSSVGDLISNFGKLLSTGFGKVKDFVINAKVKIQDFDLSDLTAKVDTEQLLTNVKRLVTGVVLATIFAIASPAKFGIILSAALISLEAALAQKVTEGLYSAFNLDFFREIGDTMGTVVGIYFAKALSEVPNILRNIVSFADAFGHAFLEQFGIIGQAISSFINLFSFGEAGILGFLMFGGSIALLMSNLKSVKSVVEGLASVLTGITGGKAGEGGFLGQALLGPNILDNF